MRRLILMVFALLAGSIAAQSETTRPDVTGVINDWYVELRKLDKGNAFRVTVPGFIDASPHYVHRQTGAAVLGPRTFKSLAATGLRFRYEIQDVRADEFFAKVRVLERGYF